MSASIDNVNVSCLPDDIIISIYRHLLETCTTDAYNFFRSNKRVITLLKPHLLQLLVESKQRLEIERTKVMSVTEEAATETTTAIIAAVRAAIAVIAARNRSRTIAEGVRDMIASGVMAQERRVMRKTFASMAVAGENKRNTDEKLCVIKDWINCIAQNNPQ